MSKCRALAPNEPYDGPYVKVTYLNDPADGCVDPRRVKLETRGGSAIIMTASVALGLSERLIVDIDPSTLCPHCDTPVAHSERQSLMTNQDITKSAEALIESIDAEIAKLQRQKDGVVIAFRMQQIAGESLDKHKVTRNGPGDFSVEFPEGATSAPVAKTAAKKTTKKSPTKGNEAVLAFLGPLTDGAKAEDIAKVVGKKGRNLTRHLVRLIDAKVIGRKGKGRGTLYFAR